MKIILSDSEVLAAIQYCLENYGTQLLFGAGVEMDYNEILYDEAKARIRRDIQKPSLQICYEEVVIRMLKDGHAIQFTDVESNEYNRELTLKSARENIEIIMEGEDANKKLKLIDDLTDIFAEEGNADAGTSYRVLQYILYKELIFA